MSTQQPTTDVIFRVWHKGGGVLALFPHVRGSTSDRYACACYEHMGQHGSASYYGCMLRTRPAYPHEYKALKAELESLGYVLRVRKRRGQHGFVE